MKKALVLLSMLLLFTSAAFALVDSTAAPIWKVSADDAAQAFIKNNDMTRSIALNKVTNHLLVATRSITHRIVALNAATGDSVGQLDMTGVSGGTYNLNKVGVADDGVIFACNLNTGSGFKVYRWADESALATVAADTTVVGATRFGDAFTVIGQGLDTKIYISGNNAAAKIHILGTTDGEKFHVEKVVEKNGHCTDIYPLDENTIWVNRPGIAATRLDGAGEITGTVPTTVLGTSGTALNVFGYAGYWYLASADGNVTPATGRLIQLGDNLADSKVHVVYKGMGANKNVNGAGAVVVQPDSDRVWILETNNAIALYPVGGYASFPLTWRSKADTALWHGLNNMVRTLAFSPKTKHLYTASRAGGTFIKVFDSATGRYVKDLNTTGISGGTYHINMVTATADGQIFAGNLALANGTFKLYHYANEEATPALVWEGVVPGRAGDAMACTGIGTGVTVYVSGNDNANIYTFMPSAGAGFVQGPDIPLPEANAARLGIAPVGNGDYLFVAAPAKPTRYIKKDGTLLYQFDTAEVVGASVNYAEIPALDGSSRKFLFLANGWTPGVRVVELFGEDGDNLCAYWEKWPAMTPLYANNANANATAQSVYDIYSNHLIELATNNGLSAYSFANVMPNAGMLEANPVFSTLYLDFNKVLLGETPQASFSILNEGTAPFEILSAGFDGAHFTSDLTAPAAVAVGESLTVTITLHATAEGDFDDSYALLTNMGLYEVQLHALVEKYWPFTLKELDYGLVWARSSTAYLFQLINTGTVPVTVDSVAADETLLNVAPDSVLTVAVGDTADLMVTLMPPQTGEVSSHVVFFTSLGEYDFPVKATVDELWPLAWRQTADTTLWHGTNNMVRTLVFNKATNHLLTISRVGGSFIKALDPKNGKVIKDLNSTGINGGTYHINMLAVSDDGQIFVGNLALAGTNFKLYYLANEDAVPVMIFDGLLDGRVGDAIGVSGQGKDVIAYVSGSDNTKIFTFKTTDGVTFSRGDDIPLPEKSAARYAISPVNSDYLFVEGVGTRARYLKKDGTVLYEFDRTLLGGTTCTYFEVVTEEENTRRFLAACDGFSPGTRVVELLGEPGDNLCSNYVILPANTPKWATVSNVNATAQIAYDRVNNQLVEMVTNNGISAYGFGNVVPNPKAYLVVMPIAAAKVDADGDFKPDLAGQIVTIQGVVTTINYNTGNSSSYYLQDDQGWGINFYSSKINYKLEMGKLVQITGKIEFYNGLTEITATDSAAVMVLGDAAVPAPLEITSGDEMNERTEGSLVRLTGYYLESPSLWPAAGKNATLKFIRGADTVLVFIDKETDIDGSPAPQGYYALTGVIDQYTRNVPPSDSYEIRPRSLADLTQTTGIALDGRELPASYALHQNYPNPFNPVTSIAFEAPLGGEVRIKVYDLLGKQVATIFEGRLEAGFHKFDFNGSGLSSGVYFYRVEAGSYVELRKMSLVK